MTPPGPRGGDEGARISLTPAGLCCCVRLSETGHPSLQVTQPWHGINEPCRLRSPRRAPFSWLLHSSLPTRPRCTRAGPRCGAGLRDELSPFSLRGPLHCAEEGHREVSNPRPNAERQIPLAGPQPPPHPAAPSPDQMAAAPRTDCSPPTPSCSRWCPPGGCTAPGCPLGGSLAPALAVLPPAASPSPRPNAPTSFLPWLLLGWG